MFLFVSPNKKGIQMKSYDKEVSITVRKYKNGKEVIQLRRLPIAKYGDVKVVTGDEPTEQNFQKYIVNGLSEFLKLTEQDKIPTFKEFANDTLIIINASVSDAEIADRKRHLQNYIYPTFGDTKIDEITSKKIEVWQSILRSQKGADYTRRVKYLFKRLLSRAVVHGYISVNPAIGTEDIKGDGKKIRAIYSMEEIALMVQNSDGWLRVFILVRIYLGVRSHEAIGLKWNDFDFKQGTVKICRGIRFGRFTKAKGKERIVDVPKPLIEALLELQKTSQSDWVFVSSRGDYWSDCSSITKKHFKPLLEKIGIEYKSFYSLRHSYATLSLMGGQTLPYVSKQLGHEKVSTTTEYYIKYIAEAGGKEKTEEIFKLN